jgi:uncharacterized membrane protein YbhN (UPF0104 family)
MTTRRILMLLGSFALAIFLVVLLFKLQHITLGELAVAIGNTPVWLLVTVCALTLGNQLAGVARWRVANAWLSPNSPRMTFVAMLEATTWGAFLGQLVPPQFSMTFARWAAVRHGSVVGVTLYEGLFDFVVLTSGAVAALAVLVLSAGSGNSLLLLLGAILAGCLSVRWAMSIGHAITRRCSAMHLPGKGLAERLSPALERASNAPARTLAVLCVWSFARMMMLALRTALVAAALLPGIHWETVLIGYPAVGLAVSVPFLPGGLGLAEWSWTGLLVLAGATAPTAALTALVFRVLNFVALCATVAVTTLLARSGRVSSGRPAGVSPS